MGCADPPPLLRRLAHPSIVLEFTKNEVDASSLSHWPPVIPAMKVPFVQLEELGAVRLSKPGMKQYTQYACAPTTRRHQYTTWDVNIREHGMSLKRGRVLPSLK